MQVSLKEINTIVSENQNSASNQSKQVLIVFEINNQKDREILMSKLIYENRSLEATVGPIEIGFFISNKVYPRLRYNVNRGYFELVVWAKMMNSEQNVKIEALEYLEKIQVEEIDDAVASHIYGLDRTYKELSRYFDE